MRPSHDWVQIVGQGTDRVEGVLIYCASEDRKVLEVRVNADNSILRQIDLPWHKLSVFSNKLVEREWS